MKLSAVLIVKNEEAMLAKCLESIKWVDEIIIVDTGSIDKTKEIAQIYTKNVFEYEWCDDFSKARNFAKNRASWDWILSIDADEVLETPIETVKEFINQNKADWFLVTLHNETETTTSACRLFKKSLDWNWAIHEQIVPKKPLIADISIKFLDSPAHELDPMRNMRILAKQYKENPKDSRVLYYLWRELINFAQFQEAEEAFKEYLALDVEFYNSEVIDVYFSLALCSFMQDKNLEAKVYLWQVIIRNPEFKNAYKLLHEIDWYKKWKELEETATNGGILVEINLQAFIDLKKS